MGYGFDPDYCVAPGRTLEEWVECREMPLGRVAIELELELAECERLLAGDAPIDADLARRLFGLTAISVDYWLSAEKLFREGLAAGKVAV